MLGYLQSQDHFKQRLLIGPEEETLSMASEADTSARTLLGWFSVVEGRRIMFYRWADDLKIRFGDVPPISLTNCAVTWERRDGLAYFAVSSAGRPLFSECHKLSDDFLSVGDDPTPFSEEENFDLLLLVRNVMQDPGRAQRFGRTI